MQARYSATRAERRYRGMDPDYRRPLKAFKSSFYAAVGFYFFKAGFA
jgi:hypothetical protein